MEEVKVAVALLSVIAVACTGTAQSTTSTANPVPEPTTTTTRPQTTQAVDNETLPGKLVTLDSTGNVVVIFPDGSRPTRLTDDAGLDIIYTQPIWSPDGDTVVWGQVKQDGFGIGITHRDGGEPAVVESAGLPFYMSFSPASDLLGVLGNGESGLEFSMLNMESQTLSVLDGGSPYYFTWDPDGGQLAIHQGETRFELVDPDSGDRRTLGSTAAGYLSPQWTPRGIFHVDDNDLVAQTVEGARELVAEVGEFTTFIANPQGTHVALQTVGADQPLSVGLVEVPVLPNDSLVVVDVETGLFEVASPDPTLGYFWSPDGKLLLLLEPTGSGVRSVVWSVDGDRSEYAEYSPSPLQIRDVYPFFPQYAQSISFWSPDSTAFVYVSATGVFVQRLGEGRATKVGDGTWAVWSN